MFLIVLKNVEIMIEIVIFLLLMQGLKMQIETKVVGHNTVASEPKQVDTSSPLPDIGGLPSSSIVAGGFRVTTPLL